MRPSHHGTPASWRREPWPIDVGVCRFAWLYSRIIPRRSGNDTRDRVASPRSAAADEARNRRKENTLLCAFHRSYPHRCTAGST